MSTHETAMQNLMRVMNLPPGLHSITVTSDGYVMGMREGDVGYNLFFGKPNPRPKPSTVALSVRTFDALPGSEKADVRKLAGQLGVRLETFIGG
jgi:hypothetical protein